MDAVLQARAEQLATEFANQHHTAETPERSDLANEKSGASNMGTRE